MVCAQLPKILLVWFNMGIALLWAVVGIDTLCVQSQVASMQLLYLDAADTPNHLGIVAATEINRRCQKKVRFRLGKAMPELLSLNHAQFHDKVPEMLNHD